MNENISDRIKRSRAALRITQQQLADACGISRPAVALWESGDTKALKAEHIFKAARALNKNPEWLATGDGEESPSANISDAIINLPNDNPQAVLDFMQYRWERAEGLIASQQAARYISMIEKFKADLQNRKTGTNKTEA